MSKTIEEVVLEEALARIETGHCRRALARDAHSYDVNVFSEDAVMFCAAGAIYRAYDDLRDVRSVEKKVVTVEAMRIVKGVHRNLEQLNDIFGLEMAKRLMQRRLDMLRGKKVSRPLTIGEQVRVFRENNLWAS